MVKFAVRNSDTKKKMIFGTEGDFTAIYQGGEEKYGQSSRQEKKQKPW